MPTRSGWKLDKVTDEIHPKIATESVSSQFLTVDAGRVVGLVQDGIGYRKGKPIIKLHMEAYLGAPESYDAVRVSGNPPLDMKLSGGVHGDVATASIVVNSIPKVIQASPGPAHHEGHGAAVVFWGLRRPTVPKYATSALTSPSTVYVSGITVVLMPSSAAAAAVTGPMEATTVMLSRSAACSSPNNCANRRTPVGLVNVTASMAPSSSLPVEILRGRAVRGFRRRAIGDEVRHRRPRAGQVGREHIAQMVRPDEQHALPRDRPRWRQSCRRRPRLETRESRRRA